MIAKQANLEAQDELTSLTSGRITKIPLSNGKVMKIPYILTSAQDKLNRVIVEYEKLKETEGISDEVLNTETRKFFAKCIAAITTKNYLKLWLVFPYEIHWRYLYYFGNMSGEDCLKVVMEAKKKAQEQEYSLAMALLMDMTTTWTTMTKKEAEEYRRELELVRKAQSLRNSQG